jgi:hypothetical protein
VAGIFLVAAVAAAASLWYLSRQSQRSLAWWGPEAAERMLHAPRVLLLRLGEQADLETLDLEAAESRDISSAPGLSNVRRGLVSDGSFDWQAALGDPPPRWLYALQFDDGQRSTTVLLSFGGEPQARLFGSDHSISIRPVAAGLRAFCDEQF